MIAQIAQLARQYREVGRQQHLLYVSQAVLANFESIMKKAHAKEAASLPRQRAHVAIDMQATGN